MKLQMHRSWLLAFIACSQTGCFSVLTQLNLTPDAPIESSDKKNEVALANSDQAELCATIGADLQKAGHHADAIVQFEQARKLDPRRYKNLHRRLGVLYDQAGDDRKALEEFGEALKRNPKDADLLNDIGYCHYNRGRWSEAENHFRQAIAIKPKHQRACTNLGLTLAQQGKRDESLKSFEQVLRPAEAKANFAFVLAAQGKRDEAKEMYKSALDLEPGLTVAHQALATLEKGPPKKLDPAVQQADAKTKAQVKVAEKPSTTPSTSEPDQSPFIVDPRTIGKTK